MRNRSAISRFKAARRQIKRATGLGVAIDRPPATAVPPTPVALQNAAGEWYVVAGRQRVAGPFDTKGEAEEWIAGAA